MSSRSTLLIIGSLTFLAVILRLIGLNSGLWLDEIETLVHFARHSLPEIIGHYSTNNHPLYSVLAHAALQSLGEHPWSLRVPAMVFGVACVPMLYVLGTVVASRTEALLAAALLTVSYHHIWFSQNARGYTILAFWAMLSTFLLLKALREDRIGYAISYGAAAALGVYTQLTMGFIVAAHLLVCVWLQVGRADEVRRMNWQRLAIGFALAATFSFLLYAPVLPEMYRIFRQPSPLRKIATHHWALWQIVRGLKAGFGEWGALASSLLFAGGLLDYFYHRRLVFMLFVLPVLLTAIGVLVLRLAMQPRYFFPQIGLGALVLVRGATLVGDWVTRNWRVYAARRSNTTALGTGLVGVVMLANAIHLGYLYRYPKQDYEQALRFVEAERAPEEAVITAGPATEPYQYYYNKQWENVQSKNELQRVRSRSDRVWLLYTLPEYMEPELAALLQQECPPIKLFRGTLAGGDVIVCTLPP